MRTIKIRVALLIAIALLFVSISIMISGGPLRLISEQWCLINNTVEGALDDIKRQYGITIHYEDGTNAIPEEWRKPPDNGIAKPITKRNMCRVPPILLRELKKYPKSVIQNSLTDIYLLDSLYFYGVGYGGTAYDHSIYMTVQSIGAGYNDLYLSQLFHHELSSVFFWAYPFPSEAWADVNSKGFAYIDAVDDALSANKNGLSSDKSKLYFPEGFLSSYGYSTLENDFNLYAEMAFTDPEALKALADSYPKIHQKSALLKGFYKGISNDFFPEN